VASKQNLKTNLFYIFYIAAIITEWGVPIFLMWPLFFDGSWYPFFISLLVLGIILPLADRYLKLIKHTKPRAAFLWAEYPSNKP